VDDELRAKIANDLKRSGFYSEMVVVRTFVSRGWECRGGVTYYDKDHATSRECDFTAVTRLTDLRRGHGSGMQTVFWLAGEVKKSERPWIVFKDHGRRRDDLTDAWINITCEANLPDEHFALADVLSAKSLLTANGWRASGIHEAFKKPSDTSIWYSAFVTACKAAESVFDALVEERDASKQQPDDSIQLDLCKPVVVLDGVLVAAETSPAGELILEEIDSAAFRFEYRSKEYRRGLYCLDLVTLRGLPAYLQLTGERLADVFHAVQSLDEAATGEHP
jgi:hypothetical protein